MADGGEGTAEVICNARGGSWVQCKAYEPLGREIDARYAWIGDEKVAVMERSEGAGMRRLSENERDASRANTFGVGEMILEAARPGAAEIIIGLGGSGSNGGGFGMARALGFRFFEHEHEHELEGAVTELAGVKRIEKEEDVALAKIIAAVDVKNPLLGENGATRVFGPQKGATKANIDILERSLTRLADVAAQQFGFDYRNEPGAGAAGGRWFGVMRFCGAEIRPGVDCVAGSVRRQAQTKKGPRGI